MPPVTILVADDDPTTRSLIAAALQKEGFQVLTAMDAMQAVRATHRGKPAAVILDVMMPAGSGLDVLKRLKSSNVTQLIPVIAISGADDPTLPDKVSALGALAFLPKPLDLVALMTALHKALGTRAPGGPA